jgi:hypothetical protein
MSPTSYLCSTPQCSAKVHFIILTAKLNAYFALNSLIHYQDQGCIYELLFGLRKNLSFLGFEPVSRFHRDMSSTSYVCSTPQCSVKEHFFIPIFIIKIKTVFLNNPEDLASTFKVLYLFFPGHGRCFCRENFRMNQNPGFAPFCPSLVGWMVMSCNPPTQIRCKSRIVFVRRSRIQKIK